MRVLVWVLAMPLFARNYSVDGIVVAVDPATRTMLVSHRAIGRYMPAMMMPFRVESGTELEGVHPGSRVQFELTVNHERSLARNVKVTGEEEAPKAAAERLPIGAALPDVCPRLSANFAVLAKRFGGRVALLSVTVDPDYDTPAVLKEYARRWSADPATWRFLTGDVAGLASRLGEVYWFDEGSIGHNSMTSIFGRDGKLAAVVEGAGYRVDQLADLIGRQLEEGR